MNVYIETFGCTFNQGDSQIMAGLLNQENVEIIEDIEDADVIIINTCYVKHPTEQKVLNRIQRIQKEYPNKKLIISGCMVEIDPQKLEKVAPTASWISPHQIKSTYDVVKSCFEGESKRITGHVTNIKAGLPKMRYNPMIHIVQISEGCMGKCTYCCARFARGKLQSYPIKFIKKEVKEAINDGCVEIQFTAQDTAAYGNDIDSSLPELIKKVTEIPGKFKIRIGMLHPKNIVDIDELIECFKHEKVYKFLHIPVQSGSDIILNDMNRGHTITEFKNIITKFKKEIPEISIATDIIVGYPTETKEDFDNTLNIIRDIKPDFIHISKYKHRPNTLSSKLPEIEYIEMKKRSKALNELKRDILLENNKKEIGKTYEVLIIGKGNKGGYIGRNNSYKPVIISKGTIGCFHNVRIDEATATYLKGSKI